MRWMMTIAVAASFGATACTARAEPTPAPSPSLAELFFARSDTLPPLGDSVPLTFLDEHPCTDVQELVLNGPEDVARLRQMNGCGHMPELDLSDRTLVGVSTWRDCSGYSSVAAWRLESERVVRVVETWYYGGSRAMCGGFYGWAAMPKLPPGWRVEFRRVQLERNAF